MRPTRFIRFNKFLDRLLDQVTKLLAQVNAGIGLVAEHERAVCDHPEGYCLAMDDYRVAPTAIETA
jgi:hypothetical protein